MERANLLEVDRQLGEHAAPLSPATPEESTGRIAGFELLRVLAVVAVVWFHAQAPGRRIAYTGLPALLILSISLQALRFSTTDFRCFAVRRARRLLVPWLIWCIIYAGVRVYQAFRGHGQLVDGHVVSMLFVGTSLHLWYLPFAFLAALLAHVLYERTMRWPLEGIGAAAAAVALGGGCVSALFARTGQLWPPAPQWAFGFVAIPLGWALGAAIRRWRRGESSMGAMLMMGLAALPVSLLGWMQQATDVWVYALAMPAVAVCVLWQRGLSRWLASLSALSFGVYLAHPLIIFCLHRSLFLHVHPAFMAAAAVVASYALIWAMAQTPARRWIGIETLWQDRGPIR